MTAGLHHRWRERAADRAELAPGDSALDVCCGTGDLALELAGRVAPGGHVVGCDFSEPMLDLAREKAAARGADGVRFEWADALAAPLRRRPLRRGHGRLRRPQPRRPRPRPARDGPGAEARAAALVDPRDHPADAGRRSRPSTRSGSTASCRCSARSPSDPEAYTYLPESVRSFPGPRGLAEMMDRGRLRADPLHGPRRRDHRDPQRRRAGDPAARPSRRR